MIRSISLSLASLFVIGSFVLAANLKKKTTPEPPPKVLMIGDSLSVASFGAAFEQHLEKRYGRENVFFFASCGSSPENWLRGEPVFLTKCGYRERTATTNIYSDFHNGKRPRLTRTPKLESLIGKYQPAIVIIQLGTNWMDRRLSDDEIRSILDRFITAVRRGAKRRIIWITPPDSSHFSRKTQRIVENLIRNAARRDGFETIISSGLTHYIPGKTGGDGVHYNSEAGIDWANRVARELSGKLR